MDIIRIIIRWFLGLAHLSRGPRSSHRRLPVLPPSWDSLPRDVVALVMQKLDRPSLSCLRLTCTSWFKTVDAMLEELELADFPDNVSLVSKFPVIKSLSVVQAGRLSSCHHLSGSPMGMPRPVSSSSDVELGSPPSPGTIALSSQLLKRSGALPPLQLTDSNILSLESLESQHSTFQNIDQCSPLKSQLMMEGQRAVNPCRSPSSYRSEQLVSLLQGLHGRHVPLRRLSLFQGSESHGDEPSGSLSCPASLCHLPHGLTSLTVVSLTGEESAAARAFDAVTPPSATHFDDIHISDPALRILEDLKELKIVNGLPNLKSIGSGCPRLTRLSLKGQPPASPPGTKPRLTFRALSCNLTNDVSKLVNLQELDIRKARLVTLPSELSSLEHLTTLNVSDCHLRSLPEEVGKMVKLQRLSCSGNIGLHLPSSFSQLGSLRYLNLSWTLSNVAEVFEQGSDNFKGLEELKLTGNGIRTLPSSIRNLTSLKLLVLSVNDIQSLPEEMAALTSLTSLDLSLNSLTQILTGHLPHNLKHLCLQSNLIVDIHEDSGSVLGRSLTWLDLSNNSIKQLPRSLSKCMKLQTLRLSFNQMKDLPFGLLSRLKDLRLLEAYSCGHPSCQVQCLQLQKAQPKLSVAF